MPVQGRSFGQERPPLTDILKNILLRYPDGGQILKELIQNADDAGAREVNILFDKTSFGTTSLVSPGLALFQGPSLYCHNDAQFTKEDWSGLQHLMRSNKKDKPLKVGRFGIGFNSVYHLTDLPSIASGDTIAFLDPHEKYFVRGEPGQAFNMEEPLLDEHNDQFVPFHQLFGCDLNRGNQSYHGTLFRFPLRTQPSELSNKIYTKEMVHALFQSFRDEASAILLFLKNIDSISLHEREDNGEIIHVFTAKVSEESRIEVRKRRQELIQDITVDWNFSERMTFHHMEIEKRCSGESVEKTEWFMANQVGTCEDKLIELAKNLQLLPWIGLAFPARLNNNDLSFLGRIFCFLPLPPESRTGLPVQVNGYFGLTDNRRALKWPGPDCQNDDTAEWNQLLLEKVGSRVYASLILNIILECSKKSSLDLVAKIVYAAFPVINDVRSEWRCILQPFFRAVLTKKIFLTAAEDSHRWVDLGEAILDRLEYDGTRKEVKDAVLSTLLALGQPVITVTKHVIQSIDDFHVTCGWNSVRSISPAFLCNVLRSNSQLRELEMHFEKTLFVLEYALFNVPENIANLQGVPLLPLENRTFETFSRPIDADKIFIPSSQHSSELLPNMKDRMLLTDLSTHVKQKLDEVGDSQCTQLRHPTADDIKQLLWQNFPSDWFASKQETVDWNPEIVGQPTLAWLELVWKWVNANYSDKLNEFEGMYLIPVASTFPTAMAKLASNSSVIVSKHPMCDSTLSGGVSDLLESAGCVVVKQLHSFVKHDQFLSYVSLPKPSGILTVLCRMGERSFRQIAVASSEVRDELCSIFSRLEDINVHQRSFILSLPIFQAVHKSNYLAINTDEGNARLVAPQNLSLPENFRIFDKKEVISSSKNENHRLLKALGVKIESTASLICCHLKSFISSDTKDTEKDDVMIWILQHIETLSAEMSEFLQFIRNLSCIPSRGGTRVAASQLFDYTDTILLRLFRNNKNAFPVDHFMEIIAKRKQELKVRRRDDLTPQDVLDALREGSTIHVDQGMALVELFNQRVELLRNVTTDGGRLNDVLSGMSWLPRVQDRPDGYPDFMPWYDGSMLCCPNNVFPVWKSSLVGATCPVFDQGLISSEVRDLVIVSKFSERDFCEKVFDQLKIAIDSWSSQESPPIMIAKFENILKDLYRYMSKLSAESMTEFLELKHLKQWVWHGNGFASPENVAFESPFSKNINLRPYFFCLPDELLIVKDFLLKGEKVL